MGERYTLHLGDCLESMKALPDACMDSLVTDPPAGIGFMNLEFDSDKGGRDQWIAWLAEVMREAFRVMKPGAHGLVWALPRTSHWTAMALELAGFEIRDRVQHVFATGFPKNLRADLALDRHLGVAPKVVGTAPQNGAKFKTIAEQIDNKGFNDPARQEYSVTEPGSPEAAQWKGWGSALKPAAEDWWLIRKPFAEKSMAAQLLKTGTGAINIDACRVGSRNQTVVRGGNPDRGAYGKFAHDDKIQEFHYDSGRWPAHFILTHAEDCVPKGVKQIKGNKQGNKGSDSRERQTDFALTPGRQDYTDGDGKEAVVEWTCVEGCPVRLLNEQSGESGSSKPIERQAGKPRLTGATYSGGRDYTQDYTSPGYEDEGGASRYFATFHPFYYVPKPSRAEKDEGLEGFEKRSGGEMTGRKEGSAGLNNPRAGGGRTSGGRNTHPTPKGLELMGYLVRLITPPGGTVLDCFMGSGATGVAAMREGFNFVGCEMSPEYFAIAQARIEHAREPEPHELPLFAALAPEPKEAAQVSLFDVIAEAYA